MYKKKMSIFLPGLYGGGAERILLNLAEGFTARGILVDIVLAQNEGEFTKQIPHKARLVALREKNRRSLRTITALPSLVRYLKYEKPEILLSALHGNLLAVWAKMIARTSTRVVLTEHNTFSQENRVMYPRLKRVNQLLVKWFYPLSDEIIAVSKGVADDLAGTVGINRNRIKVIYNPIINDTLFVKASRVPDHAWYSNSQIPIVISIGRLTEQKDFSTLLDAFRIAADQINARLVILGEGEERNLLTRKIEDLGLQEMVLMPGFVDNPYAFLAHSSVFVLSSKWEGLPTVLVEAMACGLPVVATDCPSGPREILQDGKFGRLIPVGDPVALSSAILDGVNGKIPRPPDESWNDFTVKHTADQYLSLLF